MKRTTMIAAALAAAAAPLLLATPALAGESVDPASLTPVPPNATCQRAGVNYVCKTAFDIHLVDEPAFELPCGLVHETIDDLREGRRWYDADRRLVRRHVTAQADGYWSLSPTGDGPRVAITAHSNWSDVYAVPGDESSASQDSRGVHLSASAPGYRNAFHIAGRFTGEDALTGRFVAWDSPGAVADLCAALTGS